MTSVSICIATYKRPIGLANTLKSLNNLQFKKTSQPKIQIIVIDNDNQLTAAPIIKNLQQNSRWPIIYDNETQRGIPFARNKALSHSLNNDYIAFIDDDGIVSEFWIDELLYTQKQYHADVVGGPVFPHFDPDIVLPDWAEKTRVFQRIQHNTGEKADPIGTCNILISTSTILKLSPPYFEEKMALTGGTDSLLVKRLKSLNAKMVWADDAFVSEEIPQSRIKLQWIFKRAYRLGNSLALVDRFFYSNRRWIPMRLLKSLGRIIQGCLFLIYALFKGKTVFIKAILHICKGLGMLMGTLGIAFKEYKTVHGK